MKNSNQEYLNMDHLNIDRLRLLSEESSGRVSRTSNIEQWLSNVEEYSKEWKEENLQNAAKLPKLEGGKSKDVSKVVSNKPVKTVTQRVSEVKNDSGVESDSVFTSVSNTSRQRPLVSLTEATVILQQNLTRHLSKEDFVISLYI